MSRDNVAGIVAALGDLVKVIREAEPADKADLYGQLGAEPDLPVQWASRGSNVDAYEDHVQRVCVRGPSRTLHT